MIDDKLEFHSYCDYKLENDNIVFSSYITDQGTYAIGTYLDNRGFILNELNTTVTIIENSDSLKYTFFEDEETSYNSTSLLEKVYLEGSKEEVYFYIENNRHLLFATIFIPNLSRKGVTTEKGNRIHIQTAGEYDNIEILYGNDVAVFPIKYDFKYEKSGINVSNVFFEGTIETKAISTLSNDTVDFIINFNHTILE